MGCDIHLHIEVKIDGTWQHYANPWVGRSYDLFTLLAGIRSTGNFKPIAEPKGLPADCNPLTRFILDYADFHSHSHLDIKDLARANKRWVKYHGSEDYTIWKAMFEDPYFLDNWQDPFPFKDRNPKIEDIRIVFAFDS